MFFDCVKEPATAAAAAALQMIAIDVNIFVTFFGNNKQNTQKTLQHFNIDTLTGKFRKTKVECFSSFLFNFLQFQC